MRDAGSRRRRDADRLRREAERVTRLASLLAARDAAHRERPSLHEEERELAERRRIDDDSWRQVFAAVGIEPAAPLEMKEWLQRHAALVQTAEQLRAERSELTTHSPGGARPR